jgi:UDP-N-acetylmuramoyl-tripeptide--D-alanyl-D-alanine ligase
MRSVILERGGVRVINDCYNANPGSVRAALDLTADIPVRGRRVAVLGDMLELGEAGESLHEGIGRHAAGRVDVLLGTGALSAHTVRGAREAGLDPRRALHFEDRDELVHHLEQEVSEGDLVLVKGSRGMALESVVEAL